MGKTNWATLDDVLKYYNITPGADGKIDTSGLGKAEANLVNSLYSLYVNGGASSSPGYSYQSYNPAAEQTNILKQRLEKYTSTINKKYGLSNEGASERTVLKAQQDAARRISAALPSASGGGSGGGDYDLDADAEAIFEEYYNAVQGGAENEGKDIDLVEKDAVDDLTERYKELLKSEDKGALQEQILSEAYGKLNSKEAYKALQDEMAAIDADAKSAAKSKSAYDALVEILEEGTPEYFTRKTEELYPDLVGDDKKKFDEFVDKYMAAEDKKSVEANIWYEALGGENASIEDLQMLLNKFPDASDSFRLALFDLIEQKQPGDDVKKYLEDVNNFLAERNGEAEDRSRNEQALAAEMLDIPKTEDMDTVTAEAFLKAVDELFDEEGNLDTSKVSQEFYDKNIADKYAEVLEKYGDYFEEEKAIDEETYTKQLAGEKAIKSKDGEDGEEWYILQSGENDAAEFLAKPENRDEVIDALREHGYNNLKNPDIESGTVIEVNGVHLMFDNGQWKYVSNNKNAYKDRIVVDGETYKIVREAFTDEIDQLESVYPGGREKGNLSSVFGITEPGQNHYNYVWRDGKWYLVR